MPPLAAVVLSGPEDEFVEEGDRLLRYLRTQVGVSAEHTREISGYAGTVTEIIEMLYQEVHWVNTKIKPDVLLFSYSGHGTEGAINLGTGNLSYKSLAFMLKSSVRDSIFINTACHAASMISAFQEERIIPHRGLILAAAGREEGSFGSRHMDTLITSWKQKKPYRAKVLATPRMQRRGTKTFLNEDPPQHPMRSGKMLDHYCFPSHESL